MELSLLLYQQQVMIIEKVVTLRVLFWYAVIIQLWANWFLLKFKFFNAREPLLTFILYFHCIAFLQVSFERKAVLSVNLCKIVGSLLHIKSKNRSWLIHVGSPFNSQNHPIFLSFCENLKISQPGTLHFKREIWNPFLMCEMLFKILVKH